MSPPLEATAARLLASVRDACPRSAFKQAVPLRTLAELADQLQADRALCRRAIRLLDQRKQITVLLHDGGRYELRPIWPD